MSPQWREFTTEHRLEHRVIEPDSVYWVSASPSASDPTGFHETAGVLGGRAPAAIGVHAMDQPAKPAL
ncbi:MAG: hypothetical protein E6Q88_01920 [Lysobacteraceae bacterium]|nr:MAG: hypothetical protein E6Q88_01920 [Xanthomonadaceae bacterium]